MRLSDVISAMQLSHYAEIALVLFLLAFMAIALQLFGKRNQREWEAARRLPLREDGDGTDETRHQ